MPLVHRAVDTRGEPMKEFVEAITELTGDKSFLGEVKDAFYGSMIESLKKDIDPKFHGRYDFKGVSSISDVEALLIKARDEGHFKKDGN